MARVISIVRGKDDKKTMGGQPLAVKLVGCPVHDIKEKLRKAGLRPTRQRLALGWLLFGKGDRHLCAESLFDEAQHARIPVSLATIYNTLNQFTQAGLLREIAIDGSRTYFDTNISDHHHFYFEGGGGLVDIPAEKLALAYAPTPPEGMEIARVEIVVHLQKKQLPLEKQEAVNNQHQ